MRQFLIVFVFVLSISFVPAHQYSAQAGRTTHGFGGTYCDCTLPCPDCYYEDTGQQCNSQPPGQPPPECGGNRATGGDFGSVVLLGFAALWLLKRFI